MPRLPYGLDSALLPLASGPRSRFKVQSSGPLSVFQHVSVSAFARLSLSMSAFAPVISVCALNHQLPNPQPPRSVVRGPWSVVRGPWSVVRGPWSVVRGLVVP
jgi:hypothetical protein